MEQERYLVEMIEVLEKVTGLNLKGMHEWKELTHI
jgi:hypothetical protein